MSLSPGRANKLRDSAKTNKRSSCPFVVVVADEKFFPDHNVRGVFFLFINFVCLLPVVIIRKIVRHGKPVLESVLPARGPPCPTFVQCARIRARKSCRTVIVAKGMGKGIPYIDVGFRTVTAARVDFLSVTIRARRVLFSLSYITAVIEMYRRLLGQQIRLINTSRLSRVFP